ncbi:MAG: lytic transglycosylase domain-containing protein [Zoogloeaceae bacterium]|nr:lytic transglycosylase domain-containing protein [Zoogloeaceae bacterium]
MTTTAARASDRFTLRRQVQGAVVAGLLTVSPLVFAGAQIYEPLAASVQAALHAAVSDSAPPDTLFTERADNRRWLQQMSDRLARRIPDAAYREDLLKSVYYEATRAGLDPQLVLGLIQVESGFRKYAVSTAGARGFMQVMPFWVKVIGRQEDNLFHLRTNLRYGCTILRHYLAIEKGDLFRALGRYNGSLGRAEYPNMVRGAWERQWSYSRASTEHSVIARN